MDKRQKLDVLVSVNLTKEGDARVAGATVQNPEELAGEEVSSLDDDESNKIVESDTEGVESNETVEVNLHVVVSATKEGDANDSNSNGKEKSRASFRLLGRIEVDIVIN